MSRNHFSGFKDAFVPVTLSRIVNRCSIHVKSLRYRLSDTEANKGENTSTSLIGLTRYLSRNFCLAVNFAMLSVLMMRVNMTGNSIVHTSRLAAL